METVLTEKDYANLFSLSPALSLPRKYVFKVEVPFVFTYMTEEEVRSKQKAIASVLSGFSNLKFQIILISRRRKVEVPKRIRSETKRKILEEVEEWMNSNSFSLTKDEVFGIRKKSVYLVFDPSHREEEVRFFLNALNSMGVRCEEGREEFLKDLSVLTGGREDAPFLYPFEIEEDRKNNLTFLKHKDTRFLTYAMTFVPTPAEHTPAGIYRLPLEYIYITSFALLKDSEIETLIGGKRKAYDKKEGEFARRVVEELDEIELKKKMREDSVIKLGTSFTLCGDKELLNAVAPQVKSHLEELFGKSFEHENTLEPFLFLSQLTASFKDLPRFGYERTMLASTGAKLVPFFRDYRGNATKEEKGAVLFLNDSGEPVYVSPFVNESPHGSVLGGTGAGKSFFMNYCTFFYDCVTIIEQIKTGEGSYKYNALFNDGTYVALSPDNPVSLTPFGHTILTPNPFYLLEELGVDTNELSDAEIEMLKVICENIEENEKVETERLIHELEELKLLYLAKEIKNRAKGRKYLKLKKTKSSTKISFFVSLVLLLLRGEGNRIFDEEEKTLISEAIVSAFQNRKEEEEVLLRHIYAELEKRDKKLAFPLRRFLEDSGEFGVFFDQPRKVFFKDTTVFELRGESSIYAPLLFAIFTMTIDYYTKLENLKKTKAVIIDEAWVMIEDPQLAPYVEEGLRTYRKLGISLQLISQDPEDYTKALDGKVLKMTPFKVLLFVPDTNAVVSTYKLKSPYKEQYEDIKAVSAYGNRYSRALILSSKTEGEEAGGGGTIRYIAHPLVKWISTTKEDDKLKRDEYKQKYGSLREAIMRLAEEELYS